MNDYGIPRFAWTLIVILSTGIVADVNGAIVLDHSPSLYGVNTSTWANYSNDQNFAENVVFDTAVQLTGMDIYSHPAGGSVGSSATIRLWSDLAGLPQTLLLNFTEPISIIDLDGAGVNANRKHVDFTTPFTLFANTTYWIGMSGTEEDIMQATLSSLPPGGDGFTAQFLITTYDHQADIQDMAFRLHGDVAAIPEPSTLLLLAISAISLLGYRKAKSHG